MKVCVSVSREMIVNAVMLTMKNHALDLIVSDT